jgi:pyruvate,water dikinase
MTDNKDVVSLMSHIATDASLFGAKAANLAKATQLGFTVPEGLAVSRLYSEFDFSHGVQKIIDKLTAPVAVRSSATKEDSGNQAFAGQFETRLGIRTNVDLITAFKVVKNSGYSEHLRKYHGEAIPPNHIAVLIQRMVDATRAGVAFSRDPVTGEEKVIIEGNYGLGKSVVDGDVTPDSIEYTSDEVFTTFIGRKSIQINLSNDGINTQPTPLADSERCSLTNKEIIEIASLTRKVELELGFPADIEWAFDSDGVLWLLQARPITTI